MSKFVKLSSIAELTVGFVGTMAKHYEDEGIPFLRSLNIKPFKIISDDMKYVSAEFSNSLSKSILHKGDVVIVRTGIPGTCCVVPAEYDGCNCSDVVIVHPNTELVNPHYLAAYINFWGQRQIQNNKVGAIQQHFNVHSAEEMLIFLPDITEQEKIAKTIVALNGKIENNTSVCAKLESMAKTLYDYWFTQFDFPDENGKPYRSSGGEMVWNDQLKREIPKGWSCSVISNHIGASKGGDWGKEAPEGNHKKEVVCVRGADFPSINGSKSLNAPVRYILSKNAGKTLLAGDIIVEISGGSPTQSTGRICYINDYTLKRFDKEIITSNFCKAFSTKKASEQYWLYLLWKTLYDAGVLFGFEGKTTGIKNLLFDDFCVQYRIVAPDETVLQKFHEIVSPIFDKIQQYNIENDELAKLRDWLLPMLMNGQATVE